MTVAGPGRAAGFTLVEVLVAMVIMAIMSLIAWQGVDGIVRTRESNQLRLEQTLRLETVIAQWEQDLAALQVGMPADAITCDGQSVRLIRRAENGVQVVVWALRPDATNSMWQRWAGQPVTTTSGLQDSWMRTFQFQGSEPGQLRALSGLEQWQVYFFQGTAWSNCQSTGNVIAGAGPQRQAMPLGVRIVLSFAPGSGLSGSLVRDVRIAP